MKWAKTVWWDTFWWNIHGRRLRRTTVCEWTSERASERKIKITQFIFIIIVIGRTPFWYTRKCFRYIAPSTHSRIWANRQANEKERSKRQANACGMNTHTHATGYLLNFNLNLNWFIHRNADDDGILAREEDEKWGCAMMDQMARSYSSNNQSMHIICCSHCMHSKSHLNAVWLKYCIDKCVTVLVCAFVCWSLAFQFDTLKPASQR